MTVTVLSKPSCVQCNATYRTLDSNGLDYEVTDVSEDPTAYERAKELGYMQAPVVIVEDENGKVTNHWSGFRPDKISELAELLKAA
ncbi:NrdH-like glutaredoxin [Microbacterium phage Pumpernickel]|uniref:Glutaredoxin-like protein NrdH n=1 Tax=Microbacterium phage Pumpernickel TaxID=2885983 RepID=A0AAE8Y8M2_9CAUD|nr:NrdH-like glutaredoxin [Microbacterium phage Pumpernickel]UDL15951.1 NrdH-like glutaredoxin [Microbacterium phage Pumpernickel]